MTEELTMSSEKPKKEHYVIDKEKCKKRKHLLENLVGEELYLVFVPPKDLFRYVIGGLVEEKWTQSGLRESNISFLKKAMPQGKPLLPVEAFCTILCRSSWRGASGTNSHRNM